MKLLLSSVFKPYGIDDAYGRKENIMELFHNQVTREQGIFSIRSQHRSYGLYAIAENISISTTVLDFPSLTHFAKEINKGYEYIGISFITPNFIKAKKMASLIRKYSPKSKIILGGHGTKIPDIEKLIDCDYVVQGDGIKWFREFFKENLGAPFKHPIIVSSENKRLMGIHKKSKGGVLIPGIGCTMGCRFCCTSHFFDKTYTSFLKTGRELFDTTCMIEDKLKSSSILIMDENFLKHKKRAMDFLDLIIKHNKTLKFNIFSSADTINDFGIDNLAKMGIARLWLGLESKQEIFEKNKGIDMAAMIKSLQYYGITVLASSILFLESHTKENIWEDINYTISLRPDFIQFMQLCPLPQTKLYQELKEQGRLLENIPYEEWHGQHRIWFKHPSFTLEESQHILKQAFLKDYDILGPSILRVYETTFQGYRNLANSDDFLLKKRADFLAHDCKESYPILPAIAALAPQAHIRKKTRELMKEYEKAFGKPDLKQNLKGLYLNMIARFTMIKYSILGDRYQPKTSITLYRQ